MDDYDRWIDGWMDDIWMNMIDGKMDGWMIYGMNMKDGKMDGWMIYGMNMKDGSKEVKWID